jgi:hypothetical protein
MNSTEIEIFCFYRTRIAELLGIVEAGIRFYPDEMQTAARQYIDNTRAGMACAESVRERRDLLED